MKTYKLLINGEKFEAKVLEYSGTHARINVNGNVYLIEIEDDNRENIPKLALQEKAVPLAPSLSSGIDLNSGEVKAPLPGVILGIKVKEGDEVKQGQTVLLLEAMKMESEIAAPVTGKILKISVKQRSLVQEGDLLFTMEIASNEKESLPRPKTEKVVPTGIKSPSGGALSHSAPSTPSQSVGAPSLSAPSPLVVRAPLPGVIIEVQVKPGDIVNEDTVVLVLEAMKMESDIRANINGRVKTVFVQKGSNVNDGDPLIEVGAPSFSAP